MTLASPCKAEENKQIAEVKKRCEELSKETGDKYTLVNGVQIFSRLAPPLPCEANYINGKIIPNTGCDDTFSYQIHLEDKNKYLNKVFFETKALIEKEKAIRLFTKDKRYAVCTKPSGYENNFIGVLDTLTAIE